MAGTTAELYDEDFFAWTQLQAEELRRMAARGTNSTLDLDHLLEEVETLGRSERDAVRSQVRRILEHLLRLEFSGHADPRDGLIDSIDDARNVLSDKLSASLRRDLEDELFRLYGQVTPKAARALRRYGEDAAADALPAACPYSLDDILSPGWYGTPAPR